MGTIDLLNSKVYTIMTNSCTGGLPLAIIITTSESEDAITEALRIIKDDLSENLFNPKIFMTDNNSAERNALAAVFPNAVLLLCQFHVLQAIWRYIWKSESGIQSLDRGHLFFLFKALVLEKNREIFDAKMNAFLEDDIVKKYQDFMTYLEDYYWKIKESWASCFRTELITRGQTTNNICEASMRVNIKFFKN